MFNLYLALFIALVVILSLTSIVFYTKRNAIGVEPINLNSFNSVSFLFFIVFLILFGSIISSVFLSAESTFIKVYLPTIITQIFTIFAILFFFKFINVKLSLRPTLLSIKMGVRYAISTILIIATGGAITLLYKYFTGDLPDPQMAVELFSELSNPLEMVIAVVSIVILAPIFEELFFRALLYPSLKGWSFRYINFITSNSAENSSKFNTVLATVFSAIIVSVLFSLIHFSAFAAIPIFLISILLICTYERTNSIVAPIIFHSIFNFINISLLILGDYIGEV